MEIKEQTEHKYVAIHIDRPFDNPFVTIPGAYHTLNDYMRTNGLVHVENEVIPCFETDGESMDVYIACKWNKLMFCGRRSLWNENRNWTTNIKNV